MNAAKDREPPRLPGACQVCARWPAQPVCHPCAERFAPARPRCGGCARLLPSGGPLCGDCLTRPAPRALERCLAAVDYAYPWDGLIARFKFRAEPAWAAPMAEIMLRQAPLRALLQEGALLVPIPVTPERLAERGFNQAWELAKALRLRTPGPVAEALATALVRLTHTPDQHSLSREQRQHNLQGAFAAHPAHARQLAGRAVLLIDDVSTTGATLRSAAQALRQAGAIRVDALVFARTPASG